MISSRNATAVTYWEVTRILLDQFIGGMDHIRVKIFKPEVVVLVEKTSRIFAIS
jgi:hypothetical protein